MSDITQALLKAIEAGQYNAAPSQLVQGAALQREDLSPVMYNTTFEQKHIKLQKEMKVDPVKSTLAQFNRQLSYGQFGGSANFEGQVGQEETSDFVRIVVPMAYYSHVRRVTIVANMIDTVDGQKAEERAASDAAKKLAADIEFDLFRGSADYTNAGVFDGNMAAIPGLPNMRGLDVQVRQSDTERQAKDLMFAEYGSDDTVVLSGGGPLTQDLVEDMSVRSALNMGEAETLYVDPKVLSAYNKISFGKERIILAGSPQTSTGAQLRKQNVSTGDVSVESSNFLRGKTGPAPLRPTAPGAPTHSSAAAAGSTALPAGSYTYYVTACNELGESQPSAPAAVTLTAGQQCNVTITPPGSGVVRFFNVYRTNAGGAASSARFIGRIANSGAATTVFNDLGNKRPGFVTGFLVQKDTMAMGELAPFQSMDLAVSDLSTPKAFFRFCNLKVMEPRKNVLADNLSGTF